MDGSNDCIATLQQLCIDLINKLEELRNKGMITEEEYLKQTYLKKKFLKDTGCIAFNNKGVF